MLIYAGQRRSEVYINMGNIIAICPSIEREQEQCNMQHNSNKLLYQRKYVGLNGHAAWGAATSARSKKLSEFLQASIPVWLRSLPVLGNYPPIWGSTRTESRSCLLRLYTTDISAISHKF